MTLYTIGTTKKTAERFFSMLRAAGVRRVIDVRLHNSSQLAGFSKGEDLPFFLRTIGAIDYLHEPSLAPSEEMLKKYRADKSGWPQYEKKFRSLLVKRGVERTLDRMLFDRACLLCAEDAPDHCHRRVIAEYLAEHWKGLRIEHLR